MWQLAVEVEDQFVSGDPWVILCHLVRRACRPRVRQWRHEHDGGLSARQPAPAAADWVIAEANADEEWTRVSAAMARLSRSQRLAIDYHYLRGLPYCAVAAALGCTEPTARVHAHRGLAGLRTALGSYRSY